MRLALWQGPAAAGDARAAFARLEAAAREAAEVGADVLVLPEMSATGYDIPAETTTALAEPARGPLAAEVGRVSRETGVAVVYGFPERTPDGAVHNTVQLVADGEPVLTHRKMHLFGELDRDRFAPGDAPPAVAEVAGRRVSLLICFDVEFPESVRAAARAGADVVLVPTANMAGFEPVSRLLVPARAYENRVTVAYANYVGGEGGQEYCGLSTVARPDGVVHALDADEEGLLVVDVPEAPAGDVPDYPSLARRDLLG